MEKQTMLTKILEMEAEVNSLSETCKQVQFLVSEQLDQQYFGKFDPEKLDDQKFIIFEFEKRRTVNEILFSIIDRQHDLVTELQRKWKDGLEFAREAKNIQEA